MCVTESLRCVVRPLLKESRVAAITTSLAKFFWGQRKSFCVGPESRPDSCFALRGSLRNRKRVGHRQTDGERGWPAGWPGRGIRAFWAGCVTRAGPSPERGSLLLMAFESAPPQAPWGSIAGSSLQRELLGGEWGGEGGPCGVLSLTMTSVCLAGQLSCAPDLGCFSPSKASCALPPSASPCPWPSASSPRCPRSVTRSFWSPGGARGHLWKGPRAPLSGGRGCPEPACSRAPAQRPRGQGARSPVDPSTQGCFREWMGPPTTTWDPPGAPRSDLCL